MSFLGNKQLKNEVRLTDKIDENLKNVIREKLSHLQNKNKILNEKVKN